MTTLTLTEDLPKVFRVYFLSKERPTTLADFKLQLFNCGVHLYQKLFGLESNAVHIIVQLGKYTYEVTANGTVRREYANDQPLDFPGRLLTYWELDLLFHEIDQDSIRAAKFVLDSKVGKKTLDLKDKLIYLSKYLLGLDPGELPYTCVSPANFALDKLLGLTTTEDAHLPSSLVLVCCVLENYGFGVINDLLPVNIEFT